MQLTSWLTVVGGAALVGGAIDFFIGKKGQQQVREWLELRWYRTADIDWDNVATKEAQAYIRFFDTLVGASVFTWRRFSVSLTLSIFSMAISTLVSALLRPLIIFDWLPLLLCTTVGLSAVTFSLSLSLTRIFARLSTQLIGRGIIKNVVLFVVITIIYYLVVVLWLDFVWLIRHEVTFNITAIFLYLIGTENFEGFYHSLLQTRDALEEYAHFAYLHVTHVDTLFTSVIMTSFINVVFYKHEWFLQILMDLNEAIIIGLATIPRILFSAGFVTLFVLQGLIRGPVLLVWARLVENEKPVFTMIFGGAAAIAKAIESAVSAS